MGKSTPLTTDQIAAIHLAYAETGSYAAAAEIAGVSDQTARRYIKKAEQGDIDPVLSAAVAQKKADIVAVMAEARMMALQAMMDPEKLAKTSPTALATVVGILTDKMQLLKGEPTSITESRQLDLSQLSADELETIAEISEKLHVTPALPELAD